MKFRAMLILAGLALAVQPLAGCNSMGIGTRVKDLGKGRYRIVTSNAEDVAKENAAAARDTCPHGYTLVDKGSTAEGFYGSVVRGSDLGTYWVVKCVEPQGQAQ
jgi:hypothetical protein